MNEISGTFEYDIEFLLNKRVLYSGKKYFRLLLIRFYALTQVLSVLCNVDR